MQELEIFVSFSPADERFSSNLVTRLSGSFPGALVHLALVASRSFYWPNLSWHTNTTRVFVPVLSPSYLQLDQRQDLALATQRALEGKLRLIPVVAQPCKPSGFVGMVEKINFTNGFRYDDAFASLVSGINGEHKSGAEPGAVRAGVLQRELGNVVFGMVNKQPLPMSNTPLGLSESGMRFGRSIFLSYCSRDTDFVSDLSSRLLQKLNGFQVRDRQLESIYLPFADVLARDFRAGDVFLPVLSPEYLRDSERREELAQAERLAVRGEGRLVPAILRPCTPSGFVGMLVSADFTAESKHAASTKDLVAAIESDGGSERPEPGDVRMGLTVSEIGRAAEAINQAEREGSMQERLEFNNLTNNEILALQQDIEAEIDATLVEIQHGDYDDELQRVGIVKESVPDGPLWRVEQGAQEMSGAEIALLVVVAKGGLKIGDRVLTDLWKDIIFPRIRTRYGSKVKTKKSTS